MKKIILGIGFALLAYSLLRSQVIETAVPAYGEIYMSAGAATTITSGTPIKALGTTTLGRAAQFDMPANNRLRYTGAKTSIFDCSVNTSAESDGGAQLFSIFLSDTGTVDLTSEIDLQISNPNEHVVLGTCFLVELAQNEYVELFIDTAAGNPDVTVDHMTLCCTKQN